MQIRITIINTFTFKNTVFSKNIVFLWLCISSETKNVKMKYKYCKYAISINCADTQLGQVYIQREFIHSIYWKTDLLNTYGNFCYSSGLQHILFQHFHFQCPQKKKSQMLRDWRLRWTPRELSWASSLRCEWRKVPNLWIQSTLWVVVEAEGAWGRPWLSQFKFWYTFNPQVFYLEYPQVLYLTKICVCFYMKEDMCIERMRTDDVQIKLGITGRSHCSLPRSR